MIWLPWFWFIWWASLVAAASVSFRPGDKVKWYGQPGEVVAVRGDRVWVTAHGRVEVDEHGTKWAEMRQDVITSAEDLATHQRTELVKT